MKTILQWGNFLVLLFALWGPVLFLALRKNLHDNLPELLIKSFLVSFFQFFLIALGIFYCRVPINLIGWLVVYATHVLVSMILVFIIPSRPQKESCGVRFGKTSLWYLCGVGLLLCLFVFGGMRETAIVGDSNFYWFLKGWAFFHTQDIYDFSKLPVTSYPLMVPLIYNFFIVTKCGLGIAGYAVLLVGLTIMLTVVKGWCRAGHRSILLGIPLALYLPLLFKHQMYHSYADIPLAIALYLALLFVIDAIYDDFSAYPAAVLLASVPMIKSNGNYLLAVTVLVSTVFLFTSKNDLRKKISLWFKLFAPPLFCFVIFKAIMLSQGCTITIANMFTKVFMEEVFYSPNPVFSLGVKVAYSVRSYLAAALNNPTNFLYLFPIIAVFWWGKFDLKARFLLAHVWGAMVVTVCVVYTLVPDADRAWWFITGFDRALYMFGPIIVGFLFQATNEILYRWNDSPSR